MKQASSLSPFVLKHTHTYNIVHAMKGWIMPDEETFQTGTITLRILVIEIGESTNVLQNCSYPVSYEKVGRCAAPLSV